MRFFVYGFSFLSLRPSMIFFSLWVDKHTQDLAKKISQIILSYCFSFLTEKNTLFDDFSWYHRVSDIIFSWDELFLWFINTLLVNSAEIHRLLTNSHFYSIFQLPFSPLTWDWWDSIPIGRALDQLSLIGCPLNKAKSIISHCHL